MSVIAAMSIGNGARLSLLFKGILCTSSVLT